MDFDVGVTDGVSTQYVPDELKKAVADKPLASLQPPVDGWEIVDVVEEDFTSSKGKFRIRVVAEPAMASRNMNYRTVVISGYYRIVQEPLHRESTTHSLWLELFSEWSELGLITMKLSYGNHLNRREEEWIKEVSNSTGWEVSDVIDELGSLDKDPSERVERYLKLFRDLLDKTHPLHEYFYEGHLDEQTFKERWEEAIDLLKKVGEIIPEVAGLLKDPKQRRSTL